jgi:hypothetical protein
MSDVARVSANLPAIGAQLLLRRAFAPVLPVLANVVAPLHYIATNIATVRTDVSCVRPDLMAVGAQFAAFPTVDISLRGRRGSSNGQQCGQQERTTNKGLHLHLRFLHKVRFVDYSIYRQGIELAPEPREEKGRKLNRREVRAPLRLQTRFGWTALLFA